MTGTKLKLVKPPKETHVNVLLYGDAKTGKTTGACSAPGPLLLVNADRPNASRYAHELHGPDEIAAEGLATLGQVVEAAKAGDYASIVIDPVDELYRIVLEDLSKQAMRPSLPTYGDTGTYIERFCRAMVEAPCHTILVCHQFEDKNESSGEIEKRPYTGTKNPVLAEKLMAMVDVIGYTGAVPDEEAKTVRYMATLVDTAGRRGGTRWASLGTSREVDIAEWVSTVQTEPKGEMKTTPKAA